MMNRVVVAQTYYVLSRLLVKDKSYTDNYVYDDDDDELVGMRVLREFGFRLIN